MGTVTPEATVSVISRVTGELNQVRFTEGQMVKRGDVLAIIDPAPFQAALNQAQGTLAHDEALLADAKLDLQRFNTLVAQNSIATQTRDTQAALVKQDEGLVASDRGAVDTDRLNLHGLASSPRSRDASASARSTPATRSPPTAPRRSLS